MGICSAYIPVHKSDRAHGGSLPHVASGLSFPDSTRSALLALVIYEYLITLDSEVHCVWRRKLTAISFLLIAARWTMILLQVIQWIPVTPNRYVTPVCAAAPLHAIIICMRLTRCREMAILEDVIYGVSEIQIVVFSAIRVVALSHESRFRYLLYIGLSFFIIVPMVTNIITWVTLVAVDAETPISGCVPKRTLSDHGRILLFYFTRGCEISGDILALILTWARTLHHWRESRRFKMHISVTTLLLRDGTIFFMTLLVANVTMTVSAVVHSRDQRVHAALAQSLLQALPSVLMPRFMMNLRLLGVPGEIDSIAQRFSCFSMPDFEISSVHLDSITAPLEQDSVLWQEDKRSEDCEQKEGGGSTAR